MTKKAKGAKTFSWDCKLFKIFQVFGTSTFSFQKKKEKKPASLQLDYPRSPLGMHSWKRSDFF